MATDCITQTMFRFQQNSKPVLARFDVAHASSDGGAVLLKAIDAQLRLTEQLADTLSDPRQAGKIRHQGIELLRQRVFGVACGYADCNDAARLADDPIHKLLVDRDPLTGAALGSQPTLSRFENGVRRGALYALGEALADTVIASHQRRLKRRPVRRITIDFDPTDDPTHGQQELAFFNGHYDTWCYLPLIGTLTFNDERIQYLVAAVLRPGNVRVEKRARRLMGRARVLSRASGETEHLFGETRYAAKKWSHQRRVIMKAEVVRHPGRDPKNNPRFVVTNLPDTPAHVYAIYCARGDMENRLKELHHGLELDRTSCSRFMANQFRVLLTAAAYVLFQELQRRAHGTACAGAQVTTLRERLLKVAVWIERSVRRIVLHLPTAFPWLRPWQQLARAVGATS